MNAAPCFPPRRTAVSIVSLGLALALAPFTARAQTARPIALSVVEHALGASPVRMVAGHGALTAGVARDSDLAVLAWPSPSCCDQLTHLASNAPDARSQPRTGVREGMGIALGLYVETPAPHVAWFHDASEWDARPGYVDDASLEPRVTLHHRTLGLDVTVTDTVLPDHDVLQRRVTVQRAAGSPVTTVALLTHANLGLTSNVIPRVPVGDYVLDVRNDFAALWDEADHAALHLRPADRAPVTDVTTLASAPALPSDFFGPLDALMRRTDALDAAAASLAADVDHTFGAGVYAMVATDPPAAQFHIGREDDAPCDTLGALIDNVAALGDAGIPLPISPDTANAFRCSDAVRPSAVARARGWTRPVPSAWSDAQDGALAGNPVAAYLTDSAQRTPIALDAASGAGEVRVFFAFGRTAADARAALATARAMNATAFEAADHAAWAARAVTLPDALPDTIAAEDRARIVRAAHRAVLHVYNGTDRATGAIVASIARAAPYGLDWPRDGAFFGYALDVAGDPAAVSHRLGWALPLARAMPVRAGQINPLLDPAPPRDPRNGLRQYPEAAWEMNYYNTGAMGGFFRFEIDNTALMVWSAASHVAYVPAAERMAAAQSYWPQLQRSAELLASWRDGATGLCAPAQEDDNADFTQGLHGGVTVFAALEAAARVARLMGDEATAARWEHRAGELRDVLVARFYDASQHRFVVTVTGAAAGNPGSFGLGPTAWLVWPARLLPYDDPRVAAQVRYDLGEVLRILRAEPGTEGGGYLVKTTLAAAMYVANGGDRASVEPLLEEAVTRLARDVIDPDTQVMGEVFVTLRDADGGAPRFENRVSLPHLWEGALFYLTTMAMSAPGRFELERRTLPANQTPAPGTVPFVPDRDAGAPFDAASSGDGGADGGTTPVRVGGACGCRAAGASHEGARGALGALLLLACACASRRGRARRRGLRTSRRAREADQRFAPGPATRPSSLRSVAGGGSGNSALTRARSSGSSA